MSYYTHKERNRRKRKSSLTFLTLKLTLFFAHYHCKCDNCKTDSLIGNFDIQNLFECSSLVDNVWPEAVHGRVGVYVDAMELGGSLSPTSPRTE